MEKVLIFCRGFFLPVVLPAVEKAEKASADAAHNMGELAYIVVFKSRGNLCGQIDDHNKDESKRKFPVFLCL